jgi:adenosylcobinamide-GDP ribazoletransferase
VLLVRTTPYIREDALSKAKPIGNEVNTVSLWIASLTALPFLLLLPLQLTVLLLPAALLVYWRFRHYIMKRTGGYSGDVLGALQQLVEVTLYVVAVIYYNHF